MIPEQSEPRGSSVVKPPSDTRLPAAQTASGIQPLTGAVPGVLATTQKISDAKPVAPAPAKPEPVSPLVTQKISGALQPSSPPPDLSSLRTAGPKVTQKISPGAAAPANDARERLSDLIAGLQRDNAELRKKLAAAPVATAITPAATPPSEPPAELEQLRKDLAAREARIKELDTADGQMRRDLETAAKVREEALASAAKLQIELDAARQNAQAQTAQAESATQRERAVSAQMTALAEQARRIEARAAESESRLAVLQDELRAAQESVATVTRERDEQRNRASQQESDAMTARREIEAMQSEILRLKKELSSVDAETEAIIASLRARAESIDAERARDNQARAEAVAEIDRLRTDLNREVAGRKNLESRIARDHDEIDRLTSEKSALRIACSELEDRARDLDVERARANELQKNVVGIREENAFLREQLQAGTVVATDLDASKKRISELEVENEILKNQAKHPRPESKSLQAASGASINESRMRRRIEELEETLRAAETATRTLKARLATTESEKRSLQLKTTTAGVPDVEKVHVPVTAPAPDATPAAQPVKTSEPEPEPESAPASAPSSPESPAVAVVQSAVPRVEPVRHGRKPLVAFIAFVAAAVLVAAIMWLAGILDLSGIGIAPRKKAAQETNGVQPAVQQSAPVDEAKDKSSPGTASENIAPAVSNSPAPETVAVPVIAPANATPAETPGQPAPSPDLNSTQPKPAQ